MMKKGLRIGINLLPYTYGMHGGAEVYLMSLAKQLAIKYPEHAWVLVGRSELLDRFEDGLFEKRTVAKEGLFARRWGRIFYEQAFLWQALLRLGIDCFISNYVSPILAFCPTITVVHDMRHERYPQTMELLKLWYWRLMIPWSIRKSKCVVTVSHFSKQEICKAYPFVGNKVFVTVEGVNPTLAKYVGLHRGQSGGFPFLLSVATFGKHKNLEILIRALAELRDPPYSDWKLVMVGAARTPDARENLRIVRKLVFELGQNERVVILGHVSAEELASLYQRAQALVLPSLHEGFGLPIIEAQFFGCPVLCSNCAALPETAGDAALFFDPFSLNSLVCAIRELAEDSDKRTRLISDGYKNVKRFAWEKASDQMMQAIEFAIHQTGDRL